jgi:uncharacterized repeat protein (TIGR01451 family)
MTQRRSLRTHLVAAGAVLAAMLVALATASATFASPAAVDTEPPRPTLTPAAPPAQNPEPEPQLEPNDPSSSPDAPCESVCGRVIDLSSLDGEPGATVRFAGAGWSLDAQTGPAGDYGYGRLGQDTGLINVAAAAQDDLHPITHDIALAVPAGRAIVVNLGINRGADRGQPLIIPAVSVSPGSARPGEQVVFTVVVRNTLAGTMSRVWLTDLLPAGLSLSGVAADRGEILRSGNYAAVNIAGLSPGEEATLSIYADVDSQTPPGRIRNIVSLIYAEHAAAQSAVELHVGAPPVTSDPAAGNGAAAPSGAGGPHPSEVAVTLPVTGLGHQMAGAAAGLLLVLLAVRRLRLHRLR